MRDVMCQAQTWERLTHPFSFLSAILRYDSPTFICNARNPNLIPHALPLKLQNVFDFWYFVAQPSNEFNQAVNMGLSDTLVKNDSRLRHAASLSR